MLVDTYFATMPFDDAFDDKQPEPDTVIFAGRALPAQETPENIDAFFLRHAFTAICYFDSEPLVTRRNAHVDYSFLWAVLAGIRQQVYHHLGQPHGVGIKDGDLKRLGQAQALVTAVENGLHDAD